METNSTNNSNPDFSIGSAASGTSSAHKSSKAILEEMAEKNKQTMGGLSKDYDDTHKKAREEFAVKLRKDKM